MYFASPKTTFEAGDQDAFWELARRTKEDVTAAATPEALKAGVAAMRGLVASGLTRARAAEMLQKEFAEDLLLSNLGRTTYDSSFGELFLESVWGPAVLAGLPEMRTVGVVTTNEELCLLLTSYRSIPELLETMLRGVCEE